MDLKKKNKTKEMKKPKTFQPNENSNNNTKNYLLHTLNQMHFIRRYNTLKKQAYLTKV